MLAFNQILARIKNNALSHLQIDSFYYGSPSVFDEQSENGEANDVSYGAMFVEPIPGTFSPDGKYRSYRFKCYLLDRVDVGKRNEQEVQSDMSLVASDMVAMMGNSYYRDIVVSNLSPFEFITEQLNDLCAGVSFEIDLQCDYVPDICSVPALSYVTSDVNSRLLSFNAVVERIKTNVLNHLQVNTFYQGDPHEFDEQSDNQKADDVIYPACFCQPLQGSINRDDKTTVYNFKLTFLDRVEVGKANEQEVQSDMDLVASDVVCLLRNSFYRDWQISGSLPVVFVSEMLGDMCAGVELDLSISVDYVPDVCQIPRDAILTEDGFDIVTEQYQTVITE